MPNLRRQIPPAGPSKQTLPHHDVGVGETPFGQPAPSVRRRHLAHARHAYQAARKPLDLAAVLTSAATGALLGLGGACHDKER